MAVVSDILYQALRKCKFRNTGDTTRVNEALAALNLMLKSWDENMIIPTKETFTLTASTYTYTIGSGGALDTTRPLSILSAYIQDSSGLDYEVEVSMSEIDYDRIDDKDAEARPTKLYYAAEFSSSLGKIYFNSAPESAETLQLTSNKGHSVYSALTDTIVQPPEYEKAMIYNLAVDIAEELGVKLAPSVFVQAERTKSLIEARNYKVPRANFDRALLRT